MSDEYKPHVLHHPDGRERRVQSVEESVSARFDGFAEKADATAYVKAHDKAVAAAVKASEQS